MTESFFFDSGRSLVDKNFSGFEKSMSKKRHQTLLHLMPKHYPANLSDKCCELENLITFHKISLSKTDPTNLDNLKSIVFLVFCGGWKTNTKRKVEGEPSQLCRMAAAATSPS